MHNDTIVVTCHSAFITLLIERGIVEPDTPVIEHVEPDDVFGKHVIGALPLELAALAASVTEIQMNLTPADMGQELTIERLREITGSATTYIVERVKCGRRPEIDPYDVF